MSLIPKSSSPQAQPVLTVPTIVPPAHGQPINLKKVGDKLIKGGAIAAATFASGGTAAVAAVAGGAFALAPEGIKKHIGECVSSYVTAPIVEPLVTPIVDRVFGQALQLMAEAEQARQEDQQKVKGYIDQEMTKLKTMLQIEEIKKLTERVDNLQKLSHQKDAKMEADQKQHADLLGRVISLEDRCCVIS